ncbi:MAG: caspase family protein [Bacteroidia bacterium]|nr:caspase family protein [Bacteroidia bacterium]
MSNIYALLIGINKYPEGLNSLIGCVRDAERVETHLNHFFGNNQVGKELHILKLLDEQASKQAVVEGIQNHLGQAGPDDIALFFYSGHGGQEPATQYFDYDEGDGLLETILCQDSFPYTENSTNLSGTHLCDKEMRYLFHQVSKKGPRLLAIFECCHSGDNVRSDSDDEEERFNVKTAETGSWAGRKWEQFYFGPDQRTPPANARDLADFLPEVDMIQFAAARSEQVAKEFYGAGRMFEANKGNWKKSRPKEYGGVFINSLLYWLASVKNKITYYDLARIINMDFQGREQQIPVLYASGKAQNYLFEGFLGTKVDTKGIYGQINLKLTQEGQQKWVLDLGAVHGLPIDPKNAQVLIKDQDNKSLGIAGLKKVSATSSILSIKADNKVKLKTGSRTKTNKLDTRETYLGYIKALSNKPTQFFVEPGINLNLDSNEDKPPILNNIIWAKNKAKSTYTIKMIDDNYAVFRSGAGNQHPIIKAEDNKADFHKYIEQIAHWELVREMSNVSSKFSSFPIEIKVYRYNSKNDRDLIKAHNNGLIVGINKGDFLLEAFKPYSGSTNDIYGEYDIELKNVSDESIYVSPLFLNLDFSISSFRSGATALYEIGPKQSKSLPLGILFNQPKHLIAWEGEYHPAYLKLFIASKALSFNLQTLVRDPLPAPNEADLRYDWNQKDSPEMDEWTTQLVTLQLKGA